MRHDARPKPPPDCPADRRTQRWSYGQNVYFKLNPDNDDYTGSPQAWRRLALVWHPCATILQAEMSSSGSSTTTTADHIMAHFWMTLQYACDVDGIRHTGRSTYNFVYGHAAPRELRATFDPSKQIDLWNPILSP